MRAALTYQIATTFIYVCLSAKVVVGDSTAQLRCRFSFRVECVEGSLRAVTSGREAHWVQLCQLNTSCVVELIDIGQTDSRATIRQIESFLKVV